MAISSRDLFDEEFYLNANPDVAEAVASGEIRSAFRHFERFGQFEGRDPSLLFDTAYYLAENPDVAAAVASGEQDSAFKHFRKFGQFEGRTPIAQFDHNLYLAQNQDVAAAVSNGPFRSGYQHFVEYGQNENRPGAPNLVGVPFSTDSSRVSEFVAPVAPSEINVTLLPGQTQTIPIRVAVPRNTRPLPLDVFLLQDLSGSFEEDLPIVRDLVPNLTRELQSITTNTQFGISSFIDKPVLPFGRNDGQHYVFRPDLTLTTDTAALQRTVGNYSTSSDLNIGEDSAEAQLEALLQTALRTREIGFRDGARRVVVVATDAPYHVAGDGVEAGITIPNNNNTVLDGNPPGTGEDYPSVAQVRNALQAANIVPVFAVTEEVIPDYEALVSQLGFGEVVELESDSSNLVDAIDLGLGGISSEIVPTVSSDDFGYVKGITPSRVSDVVPGSVYTFDVTLGSDGRDGDDTLTLRALGYGDTKVNIITGGEPKISDKVTNTYENFGKTDRLERDVNIRVWQDADNDGKPDDNPSQRVRNVETYVVIHGWNNDPNTSTIANLAQQIGSPTDKGGEGKQVIVVDWKTAAESPVPLANRAAEWIHDVADFAARALRDTWKIDPKNINLIGHSLGSLVASEIAFILSNKESNKAEDNKYRDNPNIDLEKRVNTLIALDPPGEAGTNPFEGYDLDKDADGTQSPVSFRNVSDFSRAFWGSLLSGDGLGKPEFARTAHESIYVDFKRPNVDIFNPDLQLATANHGNIVQLFANMLKGSGAIASLFQLNTSEHQDWKKDTFSENEAILAATARFGLDNDPNTEPLLLFIKDANTENDDVVYGSTGDDKGERRIDGGFFDRNSFGGLAFDATFNSFGNDKLYGDTGDDEIFGGTGKDTIYGNQGNDTINGEQDDDLIYGGQNEDYIYGGKGADKVYGDNGNDTLEGNNGSDTLLGGIGSDRIWGGGDNSADILDGGSENDTLTGESGNDTLTGGAGDDKLEGGNDDDTLIGGTGKDTLTGGFGSDTFVFSPGDGASSRDDADIIEDFGTGLVFGVGGVDRIGLAGGLMEAQIQMEVFGGNFLGFGKKTALIANSEYLAVLNGEFNKNDLRFEPNFIIPTII